MSWLDLAYQECMCSLHNPDILWQQHKHPMTASCTFFGHLHLYLYDSSISVYLSLPPSTCMSSLDLAYRECMSSRPTWCCSPPLWSLAMFKIEPLAWQDLLGGLQVCHRALSARQGLLGGLWAAVCEEGFESSLGVWAMPRELQWGLLEGLHQKVHMALHWSLHFSWIERIYRPLSIALWEEPQLWITRKSWNLCPTRIVPYFETIGVDHFLIPQGPSLEVWRRKSYRTLTWRSGRVKRNTDKPRNTYTSIHIHTGCCCN